MNISVKNMNKFCNGCDKRESGSSKFKTCTGCKCSYYCSSQCQKEHWPKHKKECGLENTLYPCQLHIKRLLRWINTGVPTYSKHAEVLYVTIADFGRMGMIATLSFDTREECIEALSWDLDKVRMSLRPTKPDESLENAKPTYYRSDILTKEEVKSNSWIIRVDIRNKSGAICYFDSFLANDMALRHKYRGMLFPKEYFNIFGDVQTKTLNACYMLWNIRHFLMTSGDSRERFTNYVRMILQARNEYQHEDILNRFRQGAEGFIIETPEYKICLNTTMVTLFT